MPKFSELSKKRLKTCHREIISIMSSAIRYTDFTILCGYRGEVQQNRAFEGGNSKLPYPQSKHNKHPSMAVDVCPYPIDWNDINAFKKLNTIIMIVADVQFEIGVIKHRVRWGGDWDMDGETNDNKFNDLGHYELVVDKDVEK